MKRTILLAMVAVFALAAVAQASSVTFNWGANFVNFSNSNLALGNGTASTLGWYADDFGYGVHAESNFVTSALGAAGSSANVNVTEITLDKWLSRSVAIGLGIGSATTVNGAVALFTAGAGTTPALDVRGTIQLLSGKGDKVNASLDFNLAARWINTPSLFIGATAIPNLNAAVATLGVTLGL